MKLCESLPKIEWFANNNPYTECRFTFHYIILPNPKEEKMTVKVWYGRFCYEKSLDRIADERDFPLTAEGREEMICYIRKEDDKYMPDWNEMPYNKCKDIPKVEHIED